MRRWSDENNDNYIAQKWRMQNLDKCKCGRTLSNGSYSLRGRCKKMCGIMGKETEEVERVVKEALESER